MRSPLLLLAACLAFGILGADVGAAWLPGIWFFLPLTAVCLLLGLVALRARREWTASLFILAGFVAAGGTAVRLFELRFPPHHVSHLAGMGVDLPDPVRLEGRLVSNTLRTPYGSQFDVEVRRLESLGREHNVTGKVRLRLQTSGDSESLSVADRLDLHYGDSVRTLARLRKPRIYQNPGSFDFRHWMESVQDLYWVGTVKSPLLIEKLPDRDAPKVGAFIHQVRRRLLRSIDGLYPPWSAEGRYGAVLKATLLGDRSSLDSDTIENFRRSGLYHLLVISGLHVGLLALLAASLLRLLPLREYWRSALLLLLLLGYALLVEQRAATLRATLMIFAYLVARFLYRERAVLNAIGMAGLILLLYRPTWLFESGFQLSFSAALLIGGLALRVLQHTTEPFRRAVWQLGDSDQDAIMPPRAAQFRVDLRTLISALGRRIPFLQQHPSVCVALVTGPVSLALWIANVVLFSAVIQLGLLLPLAESFHRVTFAGVGLNALATPLMALLVGVGLPTVILASVLPALAAVPAEFLAIITSGLLSLTELPGLPGWLSYRVPEPPTWASFGFVLSILSVAWTLGRYRRAFWVSLAGAGVFVVLISVHPFAPRVPRGLVEVTALDCGEGDAIFLVLPDRTTMLVDAGGSRARGGREGTFRGRRWDPGENIVSPYLWSRGVKKIDVVVLSHAHEDHLGGLAAVIKNFRIGEFWHGENAQTPAYLSLLEEVWGRGIPVRKVAAGETLYLGGTTIQIFWPPTGRSPLLPPSNDDSVVMRISEGEASVLLPGDITDKVEQETSFLESLSRTRFLKVAHHGARTSSSPEFLARVLPEVALVSVASGNLSNRPDPAVLDRLHNIGAHVFRTDVDGAITVQMRGASLAVRTYGVPGG